MKRLSIIIALLLAVLVSACQKSIDSVATAEPEQAEETVCFTLNATVGDPDTKLAFDEDGINTTWQPGDKLYLVDLAGQNNTVTLETAITEPSKSASFSAKTSVLSGNYVVLYGTETRSIRHPSIRMANLATLNNRMKLYGKLTVADGQTSASLKLYPVYAKLTLKLKNAPTGLKDMNCGVMELNGDLPTAQSGTIGADGWVNATETSLKGWTFGWIATEGASTFIAPVDLTGKKLYFYVYGDDANGNHVTYEFIKDGKNLKAGTNYNLIFDFSKPSNQTTLTRSYNSSNYSYSYELSTPAHLRAAAYWNASNNYSLLNDVDLQGEAVFPMYSYYLEGNNHTVNNLSIDWAKRDTVGLLSYGYAKNLHINNATIKGKKYVGCFAGYSNTSNYQNCSLNGTVSVVGTGDYVGGGVGYSKGTLLNCSINDGISVSGANYTGGLSGYGSADNCSVLGSIAVNGNGHVGGITGSGSVSKCAVDNSAHITGSGQCVGGCTGGGTASNCTLGKNSIITGSGYTGGISGQYSVSSSSIGEKCTIISSGDFTGGIAGSGDVNDGSVGNNCSVSGANYTGGITGSGSVIECSLNDNCTISGKEDTGGLSGYCSDVSTCTIGKNLAVNGTDMVGGLCGLFKNSSGTISNIIIKDGAAISGSNKVGGLIGHCYGSYYSSSNSSYTALLKCGFEGSVEAKQDYAGGLVGYLERGTIEKCYAVATVSSSKFAGGLLGTLYSSSYSSCYNSYSIGNVTATNVTYSGGIAGGGSRIKNCYSYGTVSSNIGISPDMVSSYTSYNLTSCPSMGPSTNSNYCNCGPNKTFLSLLSVINGDEAYSTQVWANIDAGCPLLQWQADAFGGNISAPGYGSEDW